jgi:hypothetical protein
MNATCTNMSRKMMRIRSLHCQVCDICVLVFVGMCLSIVLYCHSFFCCGLQNNLQKCVNVSK